jgi:hypothetical protein
MNIHPVRTEAPVRSAGYAIELVDSLVTFQLRTHFGQSFLGSSPKREAVVRSNVYRAECFLSAQGLFSTNKILHQVRKLAVGGEGIGVVDSGGRLCQNLREKLMKMRKSANAAGPCVP